MPTKKKHYEELMVRMTRSIENAFYLEASWYAYAILEDRFISALYQTGGAHEKGSKTILIKNLGRKLDIIRERRKRDSLLRTYFTDQVMSQLKTWKDQRNDLMHAMANASVPLNDIDAQAIALAKKGQELVKEVCRLARLLKRNRHRVQIPAKPFPY